MKRTIPVMLILSLLSIISGCATFGGTDTRSDEYVAERALQRWRALIDGDFEKAYQFETPGFRKAKSLDYFKKQFGNWIRWTDATVLNVKRVSEDVAEVRIQLEYESYQKWDDSVQKSASNFNEKWIYVNYDWWHASI